ncbi:hypothetical protein KXV85_011091, partial [Aspergillus fumigatus]
MTGSASEGCSRTRDAQIRERRRPSSDFLTRCLGERNLIGSRNTVLSGPSRRRRRRRGAPIVSINMLTPTPLTTSSRRAHQGALAAAFKTSDLRSICRSVDAAVVEEGIAQVARAAKVDRTTIYRAFRCESGPALGTM